MLLVRGAAMIIPSLSQQFQQEKLYRWGVEGHTDFRAFVMGAWAATMPEVSLDWNWHLDCIIDHLMALARGEIKKLAIAIPPRSLKSTLASVFFPSWVWTQAAYARFLTGSYIKTLAERDTRASRQLMQTAWYQQHYGHLFSFISDQNLKGYYMNDKGGVRIATSTDGSGTGEGGDYVVVDDAHNVRDVHSAIATDTALRNTINWYDKVLSTRRNDVTESRQYIMGQRVHKQDLIGHVLEQGGWTYVCLPATYDPPRKFYSSVTNRQTGKAWEDVREEAGALLFPKRLPAPFLQEQQIVMGIDYFPQYEQKAEDLESGIIHYSDILRYDISEDGQEYTLYKKDNSTKRVRVADCRRVISEDLANSASDAGCLTCLALWDITQEYDAIMLQFWWEKAEGPDSEALQNRIVDENRQGLYGLIMEDVGTLKHFIQRAKRKGYPVIEYKPIVDKIARANSIAVYWRAGMFFLPKLAAWLAQYESWITAFPVVEYKDPMDCTSILLAIYSGIESNIRDLYEETTQEREARERAEQEAAHLVELAKDNPELANFLAEGD